jgi:hypothetical protein
MKKLLIAACVVLAGCTNEPKTYDVLNNEGYTDIQVTGYEPFMCSEDDLYHTGFNATNAHGKRVSGAVCGGGVKGYTIRVE